MIKARLKPVVRFMSSTVRFPVGGLILVAAFASVREAAKSLVGPFVANARRP